MRFPRERTHMACGNINCTWWDEKMEQNCGAEIRGECAASVCTIYLPDFQAQNAKLRDALLWLANLLHGCSKDGTDDISAEEWQEAIEAADKILREVGALPPESLKETEKP